MIDYYALTGFHCDEVASRRLAAPVSATARATRHAKAAVRIARDVAAGRSPRLGGAAQPHERGRVIPVAIKPKPYSSI